MFRSTGIRIRAVAASLVLAAVAVPGVSQACAPTTTSINLGRITDAANLTAKLGKSSQGTYTAGSNPAYIVTMSGCPTDRSGNISAARVVISNDNQTIELRPFLVRENGVDVEPQDLSSHPREFSLNPEFGIVLVPTDAAPTSLVTGTYSGTLTVTVTN